MIRSSRREWRTVTLAGGQHSSRQSLLNYAIIYCQ